jgi:hypothetical protein
VTTPSYRLYSQGHEFYCHFTETVFHLVSQERRWDPLWGWKEPIRQEDGDVTAMSLPKSTAVSGGRSAVQLSPYFSQPRAGAIYPHSGQDATSSAGLVSLWYLGRVLSEPHLVGSTPTSGPLCCPKPRTSDPTFPSPGDIKNI